MFFTKERIEKLSKWTKTLASIPFFLIFIAFLTPFVTFSCSNTGGDSENKQEIATYTIYELASGTSLSEKPQLQKMLKKMETENPSLLKQLHFLETPAYITFGILACIFVAAVFALFSPLGSFVIGFCAFLSMWIYIGQFPILLKQLGVDKFIISEPGPGAYIATILFCIGFALNIANFLRPVLEARRLKKLKAQK